MRARIGHLATPRRIVATECCLAAFVAAVPLLILGPTVIAFAAVALCMVGLAPALVAVDRLERRDVDD